MGDYFHDTNNFLNEGNIFIRDEEEMNTFTIFIELAMKNYTTFLKYKNVHRINIICKIIDKVVM